MYQNEKGGSEITTLYAHRKCFLPNQSIIIISCGESFGLESESFRFRLGGSASITLISLGEGGAAEIFFFFLLEGSRLNVGGSVITKLNILPPTQVSSSRSKYN